MKKLSPETEAKLAPKQGQDDHEDNTQEDNTRAVDCM
jgi:hypothetical protein